ncbi:MAG: phenylacetate--CoA ligase family protein [Asgard group archaeon]|nr:phenylacetate--CoA ligase family protein [Asgard group archaeon]
MKNWLHEKLFVIGYTFKYRDFLKWYNFVKKNEFESYENLKKYQEKKLRKLISFSYDNIPYYFNLFKKLNLRPEDIQSIEDLQKLPILTKEIIRNNQKDFIPNNLKEQKYINNSTGGSTGHPLHYRISIEDRTLGHAINNVNWARAGYKLGDKVAVIAGSSLIPSTKSKLISKVKAFTINRKFFSSLDMSDKYMYKIVIELNKFEPKYIYGYASSIYLFARYIRDSGVKIDFHPEGIFTTAEVLFDFQRRLIKDVFNCEVFDQYGLNDGSVSAYECEIHKGLHIDMIRSIMEIADDNGNQLQAGKEGHILATSLYNYAMPFIRYDTGDRGILSNVECDCRRKLPLLKKIVGRTTDYLKFSNGSIIGAPVLTVLFGKYDIIQYQVIQDSLDSILINIIKGKKYSNGNEKEIRNIFYKHVGKIDIRFNYVKKIENTKGGKWKFIIRKVQDHE